MEKMVGQQQGKAGKNPHPGRPDAHHAHPVARRLRLDDQDPERRRLLFPRPGAACEDFAILRRKSQARGSPPHTESHGTIPYGHGVRQAEVGGIPGQTPRGFQPSPMEKFPLEKPAGNAPRTGTGQGGRRTTWYPASSSWATSGAADTKP